MIEEVFEGCQAEHSEACACVCGSCRPGDASGTGVEDGADDVFNEEFD